VVGRYFAETGTLGCQPLARRVERFPIKWNRKALSLFGWSHFLAESRSPLFLKCSSHKLEANGNLAVPHCERAGAVKTLSHNGASHGGEPTGRTAVPTNLPQRLLHARRGRLNEVAIANVMVVVTALSLLTWTIVTIKRDVDGASFGPNPYSGYHPAEFARHSGR
jgi:hypothetical protein